VEEAVPEPLAEPIVPGLASATAEVDDHLDPVHRSGREPRADPGVGVDGDLPTTDLATDRLRALLRAPEPPVDRLRSLLGSIRVPSVPAAGSMRRAATAGLAVVVLAGVAVVVLRSGRAAVDPVAVLPRVPGADAAGAAPAADVGTSPVGSGGGAPVGSGGGAEPEAAPGAGTAGAAPPGTAPAPIRAHAAGAVARPGVHELAAGARVEDLIAAAGGLAADADGDRINLAAPVADGERVYVPRRGEVDPPTVVPGGAAPAGPAPGPAGAGDTPTSSGTSAPVDLNRADAVALDALPGIGPATADAIIRHRDEHGPFTSVDQLQDVAGIGPAKLARLRDLVRV
jgi:competence protein ComEA